MQRKTIASGVIIVLSAVLVGTWSLMGATPEATKGSGIKSPPTTPSPLHPFRRFEPFDFLRQQPSTPQKAIWKLKISPAPKVSTDRTYSDLEQAAQNGNAEAAYSLFRLLQTCRFVVSRPGAVAKYLPEFDETWCEQVPEANLDYLRWLRTAVTAGYVPAVMAAYRENVGDICQNESNAAQPVPCPALDDSVQAAIKAGSINALVAFGTRQIWADSSDASLTAYAYVYAASQALKLSGSQGTDADDPESSSSASLLKSESEQYNKWMGQLGSKLDTSQIEQAKNMGNTVLASMTSCCQLFPRTLPPNLQ